ncbi:aminodeoxychorismate lyase [Vibrio kyushuensis]|uniref:aminodeoxychorismate lyase n=1 Tax=Vibrio kyushuensis TaxID=2910249 RepID=UPI003D096040
MFWVNGLPCNTISLTDRSFQYGDGCFTTMLTTHGEIQHWQEHQSRMQRCLELLNIAQPDWKQVHEWLKNAAIHDPKSGLRLNITRGEGGRGYSSLGISEMNVVISDFAYPTHYEQWAEQGIELGMCNRRLGLNPILAGHKHNNRLEQVLAKQDIDEQGLLDGIVLDIHDQIIETTMANLFWVTGDTLYTPSLENSGVSGVMRQLVITCAKKQGIPIKVGQYSLTDLRQADEIFITNSICTVVPIIKINKSTFTIGSNTRNFQENFNS